MGADALARMRQKRMYSDFRKLERASTKAWRPAEVDQYSHESPYWRTIAASAIGASHTKVGGVRQDAFSIEEIGDIVIAILADGLGSAPLSHVAATIASKHAATHLADAIRRGPSSPDWDALSARAATLAYELAVNFEKAGDRSGNAFHTTLLGVIAGSDKGFFFNVGDGAALAFSRADESDFKDFVISEPEHGNYHGEVYPLLVDQLAEHFRVSWFGRTDRLLLMTDGVAEFALNSDESAPQAEFIAPFDHAMNAGPVSTTATELAEYLNGDRANAASRDDKTLVWIRRMPNAHV